MTLKRPSPTTAVVIALVVAFSVIMAGDIGGPQVTQAVSNVGTALLVAVAGLACLVRAVHRRGQSGLAWAGIGLGALSYAIGLGGWAWVETVQHRAVPPAGLLDIGFLGMIPLCVAGLFAIPVARQSLANRARSLVDGLMIACALLMVSWALVIEPLLRENPDSTSAMYVLLGYPLGDVVLATVVLTMLPLMRSGGQDTGPLALIGAAMLTIGVTDSIYAYVSLHSAYVSGGLLDIGWFVCFSLVLLAARQQDTSAVEPVGTRAAAAQQLFATVVPYAAVLGALICSVVFDTVAGQGDAFLDGCRSALIVLIIARQLLSLLENRKLTRHLEARVTARTTELQASEARFRALVQQSSESVAVIDADSLIRYQSDSVERLFGYPPEMLLGLTLIEVVGRRAAPRIAAAIESIKDTPLAVAVIEVPIRHLDGRLRLAEMTITNVLHHPAIAGYVLNTRDIHDATELQEQLMYEAYHDALTGLASRALFRERVIEALGRREHTEDVAILVLDLDGFKKVNDSLGHDAGDGLLVRVAERLRAAVREGDTVARFGGDEFGVLIESLTARAEAEAVANRIVAALQEPFLMDDRELHVTVSIGLSSGTDAENIDQLLRNADLAMYRAKSAGGAGLTVYDETMLAGLVQRLELEADLRLALERDELALHYQPTVDLRTGEIVGFEALVRWNHPERGVVSPLDFIGIAESTGLIVPLGRWVLAEACRQAVAWGAGTTRRLKMSVNVSVRQFDQGDLSATVAEVLAETGMPVDQLCLEMTESVLLTDTDENLTQLQRLKALGVTLAMDDFGTGYSSLAYLRRYPMDILKIDRSFVGRLGGEREDEALVRTIVRLAESLGMTTVAEGIEEHVQLTSLRELNCDFAQGYLLSRPLPAGDAGRVLAEGLDDKLPVAV